MSTRVQLAAAVILVDARRKARRARRSGTGYLVTVPIWQIERLVEALEDEAPGLIDLVAERIAGFTEPKR